MENQELFDRVARHLLTQAQQSRSSRGRPMYLNDDGLKCAIGCLIPPKDYDPEFEGIAVWHHDPVGERLRQAAGLSAENWNLAADLQHVHDRIAPAYWKIWLRQIAVNFWLDDSVLTEFE